MSRPVNELKTIKSTKGRINAQYDMSIENAINIKNSSKDIYDLIFDAFAFGYAQGAKAQKKGVAFHG